MFSNPDLDLPSPHYSSNFSSLSSQSPPPTSTSLVLARHLAKLECHRNPNLNFKTEYKKLHQNLLCQSDPQVHSASKTDEKNDQISVFLETAHESENDKNMIGKSSVPGKKETTPLFPIEIPKNPEECPASEKNELFESNHVKLVREAEPQKQVSAEEYKELLRNSKKISIGKTSAKKSILKNFGEEPKNELTEKKDEGKKSIKKVQINEEVFDKVLQEYEVQKNSSKTKENEEKMDIIEDESIPLRKTPSKKKTAEKIDKIEIFQLPNIEEPIIENLPEKEPKSESISKKLDEPQRKEEEPKVEEAKPQSAIKSPKRSRKSERNEEKLTETPHSEKQMEILSQKEEEKEEEQARLLNSGKKSRDRKKSSAKAQKKETKEKPKKMSKSAPQKESARKSRKSKDKEEEPKEEEEKKVRMNTRSRKIKNVPTPMTIMTRSKKSLA